MQIWLYWLSWQFWKDLIQSDQKIDKIENLMIYFNDYFIGNQIWSSLIHFGQIWSILIKTNLKIYFNDYLIRNPIWSSLIRFDLFWSILIHSDPFWQIWFNLIKKYKKLKIWWYTLCCICLGRCCLGLETRVIIKILKNPCDCINVD